MRVLKFSAYALILISFCAAAVPAQAPTVAPDITGGLINGPILVENALGYEIGLD